MKYEVVTAREKGRLDAVRELEKEINTRLQNGWRLQGGVSVSMAEYRYEYIYILAQAMIKED